MKNNYIQVKFLSLSKISTINKILELTGESDWESGLETFIGDPKTKNNIELKNNYFKQKISSIVYDAVNNCQKLHEYWNMIKSLTIPHHCLKQNNQWISLIINQIWAY